MPELHIVYNSFLKAPWETLKGIEIFFFVYRNLLTNVKSNIQTGDHT